MKKYDNPSEDYFKIKRIKSELGIFRQVFNYIADLRKFEAMVDNILLSN